MFAKWGRFVARSPRRVVIGALLLFLIALVSFFIVSPDLATDGWEGPDAESTRVLGTLEDQFGQSPDSIVFLFDTDHPIDAATQAAIDRILAPLPGQAHITSVVTAWDGGNTGMISEDGTNTYAVAHLLPGDLPTYEELDDIREVVSTDSAAAGLTVSFGGVPMLEQAISEASAEGVARAEMISIPVTLVILIIVFGSAVAAGLPLLVGVFSIVTTLAITMWLSTQGFQSFFATNIVSMLGLGFGIDYSLFMIKRFRDELRHRPIDEAIETTMATVGKAIFFAGITVMLGLSATHFFPIPVLHSMGQAGMIVTAMALIFGLSLLPAVLVLLGDRINRLSLRRNHDTAGASESVFWRRVAGSVMARPVLFLMGSLVGLLFLTIPLTSVDLYPGGPEMLPSSWEERDVATRLTTEFNGGGADSLLVMVRIPGMDLESPEGTARLQGFSDEVGTLNGVSNIASPVISGDVGLLSVSSNLVSSNDRQNLVREIRALNPNGIDIQVGGTAAASVDTLDGITDGLWPALIFVAVGAYIILFLTFGSIFLPIKAIFMGGLSIAASLGVVVWVFQQGHLETLLNFESVGSVVAITPILIACILFGLSMDYEVLMLSRIQEEYEKSGDNNSAVAMGLAETGQVITGAAAIMVVVFGGFMLADVVVIKSIGFGLSLAVILDATVVRGLLVPATMRLMGRWNWWAPAPLKALTERLGMTHIAPAPRVP